MAASTLAPPCGPPRNGLVNRRIVSGASTLSMQVARLLAPRPRHAPRAKIGQAMRAIALERRFGKAGVLDLYLRLAPYGGPLQGVRAASLAWFGHEPDHLSLAEAALLVALPQAPERRRPDRFADRARAARDRILDRAVAAGLATPDEAAAARAEAVPELRRPLPALAFHAAGEARAAAPAAPRIRLTLDGPLQAGLEALAMRHAARFGPAVSAALVVVDNLDGTVLADIGAADPRSLAGAGRIDMARAVRSPGSALKPFIYAMAFEDGIAAPETLIDDRQTHFGTYAPADFDGDFSGSVTARQALQQSLNLPAVALLDRVGPARFLARLGDTGTRIVLPGAEPPGLALALGGLGLRLVDLARLYAGLARGGEVPRPRRTPGAAGTGAAAGAPDRRSGLGLGRGRDPARRAAARQRPARAPRLQDRHVLRLPRRRRGRLRARATRWRPGSGGRTTARCRASSGDRPRRPCCSTPSPACPGRWSRPPARRRRVPRRRALPAPLRRLARRAADGEGQAPCRRRRRGRMRRRRAERTGAAHRLPAERRHGRPRPRGNAASPAPHWRSRPKAGHPPSPGSSTGCRPARARCGAKAAGCRTGSASPTCR